jgi:hypothetical protein
MALERLKSVAVRNQHDDRNGQGEEVLLVLEVLVGRQEHVELLGGAAQEDAVLEAGASLIADRRRGVPCQEWAERSRQRLIEEDAHVT